MPAGRCPQAVQPARIPAAVTPLAYRIRVTRPSCPECGSTEVIPIAYGLPAHSLVEAAPRGEVEIGGCLISDDDPTHACRTCGHRFRRRGRLDPGC